MLTLTSAFFLSLRRHSDAPLAPDEQNASLEYQGAHGFINWPVVVRCAPALLQQELLGGEPLLGVKFYEERDDNGAWQVLLFGPDIENPLLCRMPEAEVLALAASAGFSVLPGRMTEAEREAAAAKGAEPEPQQTPPDEAAPAAPAVLPFASAPVEAFAPAGDDYEEVEDEEIPFVTDDDAPPPPADGDAPPWD